METNTSTKSIRGALIALSLPMLMASLDTSITNTALPVLADVFSAPFRAVQWIVLAYLLAITTFIVSVGRLGDLIGRRRLLVAGISLFTLASLACGAAPGLGVLLAARAAQGLGASAMMAMSLAFVGETMPRERTGSAMGLLGTMSAIGTAFGPSLGGLLMAGLGWRWLFLVNVPVGLLNLLFALRYLPASRRPPTSVRAGLDPLGTLLLAGTLAAYALAMTFEHGGFGPLPLGLLLAAVTGAALFLFVESRVAAPLVRLELVRDRFLSTSLAAGALVSTVMMSTLVVGPFYLSRALALPPALVGVLLSVGPLVVALAGVPAGLLADRYGPRLTTRAGLLAISVGAVALSLLPVRFGALGYVLPIAVVTAGYALFQTANNTAVMSGVQADRRGTLSSLVNLSRNLGLITGASVMGAVFAFGTGTDGISTAPPDAIAAGMRTTFAAAAGLMAVALVISISSTRTVRPSASG
jgi:EmrB/QacA subfamily drug resistance transporter